MQCQSYIVYLPVCLPSTKNIYFSMAPPALLLVLWYLVTFCQPGQKSLQRCGFWAQVGFDVSYEALGICTYWLRQELNIHSFFLRAFSSTPHVFDFGVWWKSCHGINLSYSVANGSPLVLLLPTHQMQWPWSQADKTKKPNSKASSRDQDYSFIQEKAVTTTFYWPGPTLSSVASFCSMSMQR